MKVATVASSSENDLMRIQYSPPCYDDQLTMMIGREALDCYDDDGSDSDGDNDQVAKVTIA